LQFTLDATPELQSRHTLFGRITGPSIYNLLSLASVEVLPGTDTPANIPRVLGVRVLEEPFGDIKPRITAEEKRAQEKARKAARRERKEREAKIGGVK
jgi:peptidyl-prolyl cis-trans isomerase SDCCAG10